MLGGELKKPLAKEGIQGFVLRLGERPCLLDQVLVGAESYILHGNSVHGNRVSCNEGLAMTNGRENGIESHKLCFGDAPHKGLIGMIDSGRVCGTRGRSGAQSSVLTVAVSSDRHTQTLSPVGLSWLLITGQIWFV